MQPTTALLSTSGHVYCTVEEVFGEANCVVAGCGSCLQTTTSNCQSSPGTDGTDGFTKSLPYNARESVSALDVESSKTPYCRATSQLCSHPTSMPVLDNWLSRIRRSYSQVLTNCLADGLMPRCQSCRAGMPVWYRSSHQHRRTSQASDWFKPAFVATIYQLQHMADCDNKFRQTS